MDKIKGILVGAGYIASEHIKWYSEDNRVSILAVVDTNEDKGRALAEKYKIQWFPSIEEACRANKYDYCDVCLPSSLHAYTVKTAMELGMDVICEKPMALTLDDIDLMLNTEKETGRRLMIAHVCRFMPQYYELKRIITSGELGRPISLIITRESATPQWSVNGWLWNKSMSGGTLMDLSIHDIDLSNWFFGYPEGFACAQSENPDSPGPSFVTSILKYPSGVQSTIIANHLLAQGHPFSTSYRLCCSEGSVEFSSDVSPSEITIYRQNRKEVISLDELPGYESGYKNELDQFISCLINNLPFPITDKEAKLAVDTVLNLNKVSSV